MSPLVLVLLARPGSGTGGAEASPPRVRARGAALEPTRWRRHGATPGAERKVEQTCGEAPEHLKTEHLNVRQLSCGEPWRRGLGDRADAAARGAQTSRSPAAAAAWLARTSFAFSARLAKLPSWLYFRRGDRRARCARPRVVRSAAEAKGKGVGGAQ